MDHISAENFFIFLMIIILLPLFFAGGWFAARIDLKSVLRQAKSVPKQFYKSLDGLIEKKTNVAAESLNEVFETGWSEEAGDANKIELGMILGKLYRQRGENDKAIALHQSLLNSPDVVADKRNVILYQLGLDYYAAGLVDRAENQFEKLLNTSMSRESREVLLSIYQQDRDWKKAINIAQELAYDQETYQFEIAQFYCELAQSSLFRSQLSKAREYVQAALHENRKCARANMILGDIEMKEENYDEAIMAYTDIEGQNSDYLGMVAEKIYYAHEKLGDPEKGLSIIEGYQRSFSAIDIIDVIFEKTVILKGEDAAMALASELARLRPNISSVHKILELGSRRVDYKDRGELEFMRGVISHYVRKSMMYRCKHCQFRSQVFFWHCPACNKWETFTPNKIEV